MVAFRKTSVAAVWAAGIGCLLAVGVAIHEWLYHRAHHFRPGPSAVLALLALAVALGCLAALLVAVERATAKDAEARAIRSKLREREATAQH